MAASREGSDDPLWHAVHRVKDNRLHGLLREIAESIEDCDDPEKLRAFGQSLKMLSDGARSKGVRRGGKFF